MSSMPADEDNYPSPLVSRPRSASGLWRVVWNDPASGQRIDLEARRQGDDVVQLGVRAGRPIRWTFSDILADSFTWRGHALRDDGNSWSLEVDIRFERVRTE